MCHDNRYMSTQNSADCNGSKTDVHEDTVNSYYSDEEAAGSSFMDPDRGSNTSLLITTPATVPISRTPGSMSAAAEYAPPTSTPLKMVTHANRQRSSYQALCTQSRWMKLK